MYLNSIGAIIDKEGDEGKKQDSSVIVLPNHLTKIKRFAIDIGGTLAKLVYFSTSPSGVGQLHFKKFSTDDLSSLLNFIKSLELDATLPFGGTGGGSNLFNELLRSELGRPLHFNDEMQCLITGVDYFIDNVDGEVFRYGTEFADNRQYLKKPESEEKYPYLLVNIGSGVSMILVTGPNSYKRVSGTSLGGGTFWGLATLLTGIKSFDEMLELSLQGSNKNVDLLVGDIYGDNYSKIGLKASAIASSMGKVYRTNLPNSPPNNEFKKEDICASLLYMVSNNIGQIAYLTALTNNVKSIYFGGYFIRGHETTMHTLTYAINFWSKGAMQAKFLRHEGYLGAMGALLLLRESNDDESDR